MYLNAHYYPRIGHLYKFLRIVIAFATSTTRMIVINHVLVGNIIVYSQTLPFLEFYLDPQFCVIKII